MWKLLIPLFALFAWSLRFIQDDAFISFRYAENLVNGHGLVFNPGEYVEGYTNFLWTLLIAGGMLLGFDPEPFSQILGVFFSAAALYQLALLVETHSKSSVAPLLLVAFLGTNYSILSWATGGLETSLHLYLVTVLINYTVDPDRWSRWIGVIGALGIMTRPDTVLLCAISAIYLFNNHRPAALWFVSSCAAALTPWLIWKGWFYGALLPNTFHAKVASGTSFLRGAVYLGEFLTSYGWWLLLPLLWRGKFSLPIVAALGIWTLHVISIGGDFMEFRLLIPSIALAALLIVLNSYQTAWRRILLLVVGMAGSLHHALFFDSKPELLGITSIQQLHQTVKDPRYGFEMIGRNLKGLSELPDPPRIATTAAGAVPYYSKLPTVDMLGLTDPWVARNGINLGTTPGHQRLATAEYLASRSVDIILVHPTIFDTREELRARACTLPFVNELTRGKSVELLMIALEGKYLFGLEFRPPKEGASKELLNSTRERLVCP